MCIPRMREEARRLQLLRSSSRVSGQSHPLRDLLQHTFLWLPRAGGIARKGGGKEGRKGETGMSEWFGRTVKKTTGLGATAALSLRVTVNDISKVARRGS